MMNTDLTISLLGPQDIEPLAAAFGAIGWHKPPSLYRGYLAEQEAGGRVVLVARVKGLLAGYGTIRWESD